MPSLQCVSSNGRKYWRIVKSQRINGKPRPIPICYLGTVDHILEVFEDIKQSGNQYKKSEATSTNRPPKPLKVDEKYASKRPDKDFERMIESRSSWKTKCRKAKGSLKIKSLAVKRLKEARDNLRAELEGQYSVAKQLQTELKNTQKTIEGLRAELKDKGLQADQLKKSNFYCG